MTSYAVTTVTGTHPNHLVLSIKKLGAAQHKVLVPKPFQEPIEAANTVYISQTLSEVTLSRALTLC